MKFIKLFEEFVISENEENSIDTEGIEDVIKLLKQAKFKDARILLYEIAASSERNKSQYEISRLPTIEFEEETGITGASKRWKMPFGFNEKELEFLFRCVSEPINEGHIEFIMKALQKMNPNLNVSIDDYDKLGKMNVMINVIMGCVSGMRLDDMMFYISMRPEIKEVPSKENEKKYTFIVDGAVDEEYSDLYTRAQHATSYAVSWFPCKETLKMIISKSKNS